MIIGIVASAMLAGGAAAVATVATGQSVLTALAVYSLCGTGCALIAGVAVAAKAILSSRKPFFAGAEMS